MNPNKLVEHNALADQAALKADQAIRATQRVANETLDSLSDSLVDTHQRVAPVLNRVSEQASALAQRSMEAMRDRSQQIRTKAVQATDVTAGYIKNDPIKAVLIAAATGAAVMALYSLFSRSRDRV
jgi:ElaB/YqjD/DUF883 family membrane-anchored ribosome-binding protein